MDRKQIFTLLENNKNERGIQNWQQMARQEDHLKSFGIGLTVLRKLAKQVGKNHELAMELWQSDVYDARVLALLLDDPKEITREQAEQQVEDLNHGMLVHVFSSCDATLAKTEFVIDLSGEWIISKDSIRRRCGYGLLYEISKLKTKKAPADDFFLEQIDHIATTFTKEKSSVHLSMGTALMGMGLRNTTLNAPALKVAQQIGPIEITSGKTKCDPFDAEKHLTSELAQKKLGAVQREAGKRLVN